ncbi:Hypothetical predicted protein [Podarcis lilfordi]|uniref:Uncharacterized protein n=1 Tax=Podarcis lilfordi TaxID=74358 RepID=A0AA35K9I1_9SAUR|nr:Hypothetical predicted protein [Podarcis lilfordi]
MPCVQKSHTLSNMPRWLTLRIGKNSAIPHVPQNQACCAEAGRGGGGGGDDDKKARLRRGSGASERASEASVACCSRRLTPMTSKAAQRDHPRTRVGFLHTQVYVF